MSNKTFKVQVEFKKAPDGNSHPYRATFKVPIDTHLIGVETGNWEDFANSSCYSPPDQNWQQVTFEVGSVDAYGELLRQVAQNLETNPSQHWAKMELEKPIPILTGDARSFVSKEASKQ
jgi:hypothetical protein